MRDASAGAPAGAGARTIVVAGKTMIADISGTLYWPAERTLVVADLHLEKGSSFAAKGQLLPPYDTRETLTRLAAVMDEHDPDRVVALGDSFHDGGAAQRMDPMDREVLAILQEDREWVWVTGNHDPAIPATLGGVARDCAVIGGLRFTHVPHAGPVTHEIAGHLHPVAKLTGRGHSVRRPCFVGNGRRLVMPAFGAFTGGLNVLDDAFAPLFGADAMRVWMLGFDGVHPVSPRQLTAD